MTDHAALKAFLVRTPFFGGLADEGLERVVARLRSCEVPAGAQIFKEGESGRSMYVVERGDLVAVQSGTSGHPVKLMRFGPGDFFGETTLIEMQPRPFTVQADSPALLHELTNADLYAVYKADVKTYVMVLQNINRELCRRLRRAGDRITQFADDEKDDVTQLGVRRLPPLPGR